MNISPLACVSENALIGKDVKIGPFVTIDENVVIGDGTIIDSNAVIHSGARIGNNCHIHSGAVVSDIPQDLKFKGEDSVAIIGDNTSIREFVTIHRGTASKGKTVIGDNCLIMAYCHVAHDCELGNNVIMSNQAGRYPISYEGVNSVGLHRRGFTEEQITKIQKVYRVLYLSRLNNTEALAKVIAEIPQSPERDEIVNFVKASKRGIVRMGI